MLLTAPRASWHCMRMTTESERISLDEFDGLRGHLHNIEVQAAMFGRMVDRLDLAVNDLLKRPQWESRAEGQLHMAGVALDSLLKTVGSAVVELDRIKAAYQAKPPFV